MKLLRWVIPFRSFRLSKTLLKDELWQLWQLRAGDNLFFHPLLNDAWKPHSLASDYTFLYMSVVIQKSQNDYLCALGQVRLILK